MEGHYFMMNYFELFDIPFSFKPDQALVKKKFYQLSRQYHPDFFGNGTAAEKENALERSAAINKAYKIFQDKDALIKYILMEKQLLADEEKYQLSPDFLMEVIDLNEQLMDADEPEIKKKIEITITELQNAIYEPVKAILENNQEAPVSEKELLQVKEYYYRKKYLDRILAEL